MPKSITENFSLCPLLVQTPDAAALMSGSAKSPEILGTVYFYKTAYGTVVYSRINRLPVEEKPCASRFFALHIHQGENCTPKSGDAFSDSLSHYNPDNCEHPNHAGDLPILIASSKGYALSVFLSDRFTVDEIIGKTVIIHHNTDDFKTQPSGASGEKIACGVIKKIQKDSLR